MLTLMVIWTAQVVGALQVHHHSVRLCHNLSVRKPLADVPSQARFGQSVNLSELLTALLKLRDDVTM